MRGILKSFNRRGEVFCNPATEEERYSVTPQHTRRGIL
jgi:hypothetical protein